MRRKGRPAPYSPGPLSALAKMPRDPLPPRVAGPFAKSRALVYNLTSLPRDGTGKHD